MARKPALAEGDRRSKILAAALEVFAERGLEGATNTAIAARAQVTHGLVYFYFPSKEDLFCAAVEYQADHVFAQLDLAGERASADSPEKTLRRIVSRFVALMETPENVSLMLILMREAAPHEPQGGAPGHHATISVSSRATSRMSYRAISPDRWDEERYAR
jgi:AcrR family transcriptional regulator